MQNPPALGHRAIIIGGSIAGLLAARALAPHFEEVVILEHDELSDEPDKARPTVPQSRHVHVLLKGGENAIERMLPGFRATIEVSGSVQLRSGRDFRVGSEAGIPPAFESSLTLHGQSRGMLEYYLRKVVLAQVTNLQLRTGISVRGLLYDAARNRVTGVTLDGDESLAADLIIDAAGRSEVGFRALRALGLPLPEVEEVQCHFGYASVTVELAVDPGRDWKVLASGNLPRKGARGGLLSPIENGLHVCSMGGRGGDYPPGDREGFLEFAKSLPQQSVYEELSRARFVTHISRMGYPANRFRHYERHTALPAGLLPVGDALCSFNPTYGQGMSSAALQAEVLCDVFAARSTDATIDTLGRDYLEQAARVAQMPWRQANFNDFLYPTTEGDRSMFTLEETQYRIAVQRALQRDPEVRELATQVSQLLIPFERLLEDDVRQRVAAALVRKAT
jgi:2-polyprenyl-6-methoxyphenol hydroxylase-like FAD-dependent oxidoreductase